MTYHRSRRSPRRGAAPPTGPSSRGGSGRWARLERDLARERDEPRPEPEEDDDDDRD